jgi:hypothetical protein
MSTIEGAGTTAAILGKRNPWMKFYPSDWRQDPNLHGCSLAARGLWMEMLCLMQQAIPYGHLLVNGNPPDANRRSRLAGAAPDEVTVLLAELEREGVFSRTADGVIYSRRMVRDAEKERQDRENDKLGGNPNLRHRSGRRLDGTGVNPSDMPRVDRADKAQKPEATIQNIAPSEGSAGQADVAGGSVDGTSCDGEEAGETPRLYAEGLTTLARLMGESLPTTAIRLPSCSAGFAARRVMIPSCLASSWTLERIRRVSRSRGSARASGALRPPTGAQAHSKPAWPNGWRSLSTSGKTRTASSIRC